MGVNNFMSGVVPGVAGTLNIQAQPYQNLSTPTAGASDVATDQNLYKNPNSPYNGMVWNESTGWQSPTSTTPGAMPIMASNTPPQGDSNTATLGTGQTANPFMGSTNPYIQAAQATTMGNLYGAQQAVQANRVNQVTPYGNLNYTQTTDQYGNPTWTATQSLTPELQNLATTSIGNLQASQSNPMYGINPGETYSSAIMRRLQPQMAQQAEGIKSDLANQGIVPGTQAYENAMRVFNQQQNDLLTSAQIQGMQTGLQAQQLQGNQAKQIKDITTPNYINAPNQATVAGPDYMGAVGSQTAAEIAANNAALGQQTANTQGLYGLGSAGILGLAANPGLVSSGLSSLGNLFGNSYNTLSNNYFTNPTSAGSFAGDLFTL